MRRHICLAPALLMLVVPANARAELGRTGGGALETPSSAATYASIDQGAGSWLARTPNGALSVCWRPPTREGPSDCFVPVDADAVPGFSRVTGPWRVQAQPSGAVLLVNGDAFAWLSPGARALSPLPPSAMASHLELGADWQAFVPRPCRSQLRGAGLVPGRLAATRAAHTGTQPWYFVARACDPPVDGGCKQVRQVTRSRGAGRGLVAGSRGLQLTVQLTAYRSFARQQQRANEPASGSLAFDKASTSRRLIPERGALAGVRLRFDPLRALRLRQQLTRRRAPDRIAAPPRPRVGAPFVAQERAAMEPLVCTGERR